MSYWDTSALVKHYTPESDSIAFEALGKALAPMHTARITYYEFHTALRRREAEGIIAAGETETCLQKLREHIARGIITIHDESASVQDKFATVLEDCFSASPIVYVRTADAIHIATALAAGEQDFVSADTRQRKAAELAGLTVHP